MCTILVSALLTSYKHLHGVDHDAPVFDNLLGISPVNPGALTEALLRLSLVVAEDGLMLAASQLVCNCQSVAQIIIIVGQLSFLQH